MITLRKPRRLTFVPTGMFVTLLISASHAAVPVDDVQREFWESFPPAQAKLESFYSQVRVHATELYKSAKYDEVYDVRIAINGANKLIVRELKRVNSGVAASEGLVKVLAVTPKRSFKLHRSPGKKDFVIDWTGVGSKEDYDVLVKEFRFWAKCLLASHCLASEEMNLAGWVADPRFVLKNVAKQSREGREFVRIEYQGRKPDGTIGGYGMFVVAPDDCWAVYEGEFGTPVKGHLVVNYGGKQNGIPLVKAVQLTWSQNETVLEQYDVTFHELVHARVPEQEFTLSAFGLPDIDSQQQTRHPLHSVAWLLFGAFITGLIAILLRRHAYRAGLRR